MSAGQKHQGKSRVPADMLWEIRLCHLPLRGTKHNPDVELQNETPILVLFVNYWLQNIWVVLGAYLLLTRVAAALWRSIACKG